ncbi:MAG: GNAT family N-acetyltransferase [Acidobacteria bacterium]|nr:GNAT family N-acetyltransferase [Acidobacteriota bacterium]
MTDLTIGPAHDTDAEWCARTMASTDPWITLLRSYEQCLARVRRPEHLVLVARQNKERCGFILIHPTGAMGSPYIASIAVAPGWRGKGIGAALLDAAEMQFPGVKHFFLCVSSFNERARVLYERHGYTAVGVLKDYVIPGASEILMHKRL